MAVGPQSTSGTVDVALGNLPIELRSVMQRIVNLDTWVNGGGNGLAYLEKIGYSTGPDPGNPGGVSDAQLALNMIGYLHTVAAVYYGDAAQPDPYDFNQQLSSLWNGQLG